LPSGGEFFGIQSLGERKKCEDVSLNLVGKKLTTSVNVGFTRKDSLKLKIKLRK
jgi:hypothetical protein